MCAPLLTERSLSVLPAPDLAGLYRAIVERRARGVFHGVDGASPAVAEAAAAASRAAGKGGAIRAIPVEEARKTMGPMADALVGAACARVLRERRVAAAAVVARAGGDPAPDVEPFHWALYASRQLADADEIRLGLDVRPPPGADAFADADRERALGRLRDALDRVGVSEGAWRPVAVA